MTDIATMIAEWAALKAQADALYGEAAKLEPELIFMLRNLYPAEYNRWESGRGKFEADGVVIKLKREYDVDKLRAEFGEERPDFITTETKVVEKPNGRTIAPLWNDAGMARRLQNCIKTQVPKLELKK